jgi:iron complex transport system substrate-binding protein
MIRRPHHSRAPSGIAGKGSRHAWGMAAVLAITGVTAGAAVSLAQSPSLVAPTKRPATIVTDDAGTQVFVPWDSQRIISLSPANTEIVYALGAGDRLVGGTDADDYPSDAAALPDVVSQTKVLTERIVALEPDLILASGNDLTPQADVDRLRSLGYPVVVVYPQTVDGVLADIRLIGTALGGGAASTAEAVSTAIATDIHHITDLAAATAGRPRTLYEIYYGPDLYAPADDSFIADLVERAGGDAITTGDPTVFSLPLEQLVVADPQVIVLGDALYGTCPDAVATRAGWADLTAVQAGAIRPVNDTVITRPGPRLADGLASLTRAIHPELSDQLADYLADPPMCSAEAAPAASPITQP